MKKNIKKSLSYVLCTMLFAAMTFTMGCSSKKSDDVSVQDTVSEAASAEVSTEASVEASVTEPETVSTEASVEEPEVSGMPVLEGCELGEGETQFTFEVTGRDGNTEVFTINTNETTVGAALLAVNIIDGDNSEYGLYVKTVNGETADWDVDQKYWAFYIDGEYAMTGVDSTEVTAGSTYAFKVE